MIEHIHNLELIPGRLEAHLRCPRTQVVLCGQQARFSGSSAAVATFSRPSCPREGIIDFSWALGTPSSATTPQRGRFA